LKIIHLSDTHIIQKSEKNLYGIDPSFRLTKALQSIRKNHNDADMIVISGDLVDTPSLEAYETFFNLSKECQIPIYPIMGNHDDRELFFKFFPHLQNDGFAQYIIKDKEFAFLFLDTNVKGEPFGALCPKRLKWFQSSLESVSDKNIYIFMHHHPLPSGLYEMDRVANLKNAYEFWNIVERYDNVKHITFGHLHRITQMKRGNISLHSTKSTVFEVAYKPNEKNEYLTNEEKPTYAVMILDKDNLLIHHHEFLSEDCFYTGYC
jgi:3',5'-cyclic AMP phosphodiesterase CpdA